jgi:hypothetical protein
MDPSLDREKEVIASWAETRGLLRFPMRVERPRDVFNPSVLSVRLVPGRLSRRRLCGGGSPLTEPIPANGLSAPTSDRSEDAECNAPPFGVARGRQPLLRRLS